MQKLELIEAREVLGKHFSVYGSFEEPLFLAKEVAEWIDYSKTSKGFYDVSKMLRAVDDNEKIKAYSGTNIVRTETISNTYNMFLTEDGLYEVLMQSRKPIAKAFKKEVKIILKEIRMTGSFGNALPKNYLEALKALVVSEESKLLALENEQKALEGERKALEKIEQDKPKVEFADSILETEDTISVGEFAKLLHQKKVLDVGQNRLYEIFRNLGYIHKVGQQRNLPTMKTINAGLMLLQETVYKYEDKQRISKQARITGKGQMFFVDLFIKQNKKTLNGIFEKLPLYIQESLVAKKD